MAGGKITEIAGGSIATQVQGDLTIRVTEGNLNLHAADKTVQQGTENGIIYGLYAPEAPSAAPSIEKVEFLDEANRVLDGSVTDFFYGQRLKIRVTTMEGSGKSIRVALQGETKSPNQPFAFMATSRYQWGGVVAQDQTFTTPFFTLLPLWYSDDFETYHDATHKTEIAAADLNAFFARVSLGAQTAQLPAAGARVKPRTYRRNYEELVGLYKTDNSGGKDLLTNYENKFIKNYDQKGLDIKDLVADFSNWLYRDEPDATMAAIEAKAVTLAEELWKYAVLQNQKHTLTVTTPARKKGEQPRITQSVVAAIADDRPLYWARIVLKVVLKRQYAFIDEIRKNHAAELTDFLESSVVPPGSALGNLLRLFEEKSRNYTGVDFSQAPAGAKKILLTGFDPFFLNQFAHPGIDNILQSNPSGALALGLHGMTIGNGFIQVLIVPVRYADFDGSPGPTQGSGTGIIETYVGPWVNGVDMIVTMSQYDETGSVIDKFATSRRGGTRDNRNFTRIAESQALATSYEWIETTLPTAFANGRDVKMNWSFTHLDDTTGAITINDPQTSVSPPGTPKLVQGSGGDYLSNEIFYRVAKLRQQMRPSLPTGHFHVQKIQISGDLNPVAIRGLLATVRAALTRSIAAL